VAEVAPPNSAATNPPEKPAETAAAQGATDTAAPDDVLAAVEAAVAGADAVAGAIPAAGSKVAADTPTAEATPAAEATASPGATPEETSIEELLRQANFENASSTIAENPAPDASSFNLPSFQQAIADAQISSIDLLRDVELNVKIELGRSQMLIEEVLKLSEGSVVELDKLAGDPVDVFVNERLVARGEVLVLNDNFCVRVNEIIAAVKEEGM
jgi:flagellar motor switch protein FliN/FliY